ncbi:hypothetical protein HZF05_16575 [Sphingomonas sp. CGMCC 1.13654]|uniref:Uncharacterized protein n=1 Tax=Sphingomonas chungangi TaxID=2683589 RepID=A0A838L9X7_9SPHN|nr:hypothetical protein [Sphingomonas chungangi]MBA2935700.1 hypothetical protein [Sphingomonas chungangi]MVW54390.1 hypothetical protein [Sphingomonas chungangi]
MFSAILNVLRGYRTSFDALENAIFAEVRRTLPVSVQGRFDDRLRRINIIQAPLGKLELNLYEKRRGAILFSDSSRIVTTDDSIHIATVKLESADEMSRLKAKLFCGSGVLTSVEFNQPSEHADVDNITGMKVQLVSGVPWVGQ